jgi:hypothetical protein
MTMDPEAHAARFDEKADEYVDPDRVVLGDVVRFGTADPSEPFYDPAVDDPSTVGVLADAFTDAATDHAEGGD